MTPAMRTYLGDILTGDSRNRNQVVQITVFPQLGDNFKTCLSCYNFETISSKYISFPSMPLEIRYTIKYALLPFSMKVA